MRNKYCYEKTRGVLFYWNKKTKKWCRKILKVYKTYKWE